jgi:hypothetical protein
MSNVIVSRINNLSTWDIGKAVSQQLKLRKSEDIAHVNLSINPITQIVIYPRLRSHTNTSGATKKNLSHTYRREHFGLMGLEQTAEMFTAICPGPVPFLILTKLCLVSLVKQRTFARIVGKNIGELVNPMDTTI